MIDFVNFLLKKIYTPVPIADEIIENAFIKTKKDIHYHFPELPENEIHDRIIYNSNELAVFLFRLGNELALQNIEKAKPQVHGLLKELCSCEIYFNNIIDEGFCVVHGEGTVIGSRNKIGKGFKIHHGCTIGHKKNRSGNGSVFGNDVTIYANSSVLGELEIGNNVIIGAHVLVSSSLPDNTVLLNKK